MASRLTEITSEESSQIWDLPDIGYLAQALLESLLQVPDDVLVNLKLDLVDSLGPILDIDGHLCNIHVIIVVIRVLVIVSLAKRGEKLLEKRIRIGRLLGLRERSLSFGSTLTLGLPLVWLRVLLLLLLLLLGGLLGRLNLLLLLLSCWLGLSLGLDRCLLR